jgi:hypothetical protein
MTATEHRITINFEGPSRSGALVLNGSHRAHCACGWLSDCYARYAWDSIQKVATSKRAVTPALALRVAMFAGISMDELLAGQWLSSRVCPHCGHPPEDFVDEETMVE